MDRRNFISKLTGLALFANIFVHAVSSAEPIIATRISTVSSSDYGQILNNDLEDYYSTILVNIMKERVDTEILTAIKQRRI